MSDILRQVIDNNGVIKNVETSKKTFFLSADSLSKYSFSDNPISASEIVKRLNDLADLNLCRKLKYSDIANWLISIGALEVIKLENGKSTKMPTMQGEALGISIESRRSIKGEYVVVVYNKNAQQFIIDNIAAIINVL